LPHLPRWGRPRPVSPAEFPALAADLRANSVAYRVSNAGDSILFSIADDTT
jgi:hypothetical protein